MTMCIRHLFMVHLSTISNYVETIFSRDSEAFASEFREYIRYYIHSEILRRSNIKP